MIFKALHTDTIGHFKKILSGNIVTQLIGLASYPVIVRIYERDELGRLGVLVALTAFFSIFNSAQIQTSFYTNDGVPNPARFNDAFFVSILLSPLLVLTSVLLYYFYDFQVGLVIFLLPLNCLVYTFGEISKPYLNREERFSDSVRLMIVNRAVSQSLKIVGFVFGPVLLFFSEPIAHIASLYSVKNSLPVFRRSAFSEMFIRYKQYALLYVPIGVINFFTIEGPVLLAGHFGSLKEASAFFLLNRMLFSPLNLVGNSFSSSIVAKLARKKEHERFLFLIKIYTLFICAGFFLTVLTYFAGGQLLIFLLGAEYSDLSQWIMALSFVIPLKLLKGIVTNVGINSGRNFSIYLTKMLMGLSLFFLVFLKGNLNLLEMFVGYFLIELIFETANLVIGLLPRRDQTHLSN